MREDWTARTSERARSARPFCLALHPTPSQAEGRRPHFSVGRVIEQSPTRDSALRVQFGAGTLKRSSGEDTDSFESAFVLHQSPERQETWFDPTSPR